MPRLPFPASLGASQALSDALTELAPPRTRLGRVAEDRRIHYVVALDPAGDPSELLCEYAPERLRDYRKGSALRPVVGDWVFVEAEPSTGGLATIEHVHPRAGWFSRRRPHTGEEQVLAANIDEAFLLSAAGPDFNPRRIERYLTAAKEARARPLVVLGKVDLVDDLTPYREALASFGEDLEVLPWSAETLEGLDFLRDRLRPGRTAALLGSSGVGKSTLINRLCGERRLATQEVRRDGKGRHTTTTRQLIVLEDGGVVIDTPGIRELALWEAREGLSETFEEVEAAAAQCRFRDCRHGDEPGCAVVSGMESGSLDPDRVASFLKLRDELESAERERAARRKPPRHLRGRGRKKR